MKFPQCPNRGTEDDVRQDSVKLVGGTCVNHLTDDFQETFDHHVSRKRPHSTHTQKKRDPDHETRSVDGLITLVSRGLMNRLFIGSRWTV